MPPGRIVILNGTSSSGKTTLAHRIHDVAEDLWIVVGQDDFTHNLLPHHVSTGSVGDTPAQGGFLFATAQDGSVHVEVGPVGGRVLRGYRRAVAALGRAGNNVVVAECKFDPGGWADWAEALRGLPVLWVAVRCALEECLRRERERGDRLTGLAAGHYEIAHADAEYDLEVDLTDSALDEAARAVLRVAGKHPAAG